MKERQCSKCGGSLTSVISGGLCPRCLMAMNMADQTELTGAEGDEGVSSGGAESPDIDVLRALFPQFDLLELLGRGGMGVVYKARQKSLDRLVALKILAPERKRDDQFAERFSREAKILARLSQPNIVTIHDFGEVNGMCYLVMELVDGCNLRTLLQQGAMPPEKALAIVPAICSALEYAHRLGVVHRDIKPENVLVDRCGKVKIVDFGIAKILGLGESSAPDQTKTTAKGASLTLGKRLGTPSYMAPEQAEEPTLVDHRADIYSLGIVFYEMLTGELPAESFEPPSKKVQIDVRIDEAVIRAIDKEPERRYQTAAELKEDVETVVEEEGGFRKSERGSWFPGRSPLAKRIASHRADAEKALQFKAEVRLGLLWVIPLFLTYVIFDLFFSSVGIEWVLLVQSMVLLAMFPVCFLKDRELLCSTQWAMKRGISSRDLRWFANSPWKRILGNRRFMRRCGVSLVVLIGFVVLGAIAGAWLQRPLPLGQVISSTSPDDMLNVTAQTIRAMRIFGGDEVFFRFRVQGYAGALFERWDVPVPFQQLAEDFILLSLDSIQFDPHGSIVWSDDNHRVSFRVNGVEVSAFNALDGSHSFEGGYLPQKHVVLQANESLRESFIDLDQGLVLSAPSALESQGQMSRGAPQIHVIQEWMQQSGADLVFRFGLPVTGVHGVSIGVETEGIAGDPRAFDTISVERARSAIRAVEDTISEFPERVKSGSPHSSYLVSRDSVAIIKTREGGIGLVEILKEPSDSKVELRIKMLAPLDARL